MHAHGIEVFHGANGNYIANGIPHDFKLNFFPSGDVFFNEHLGDGRHIQTRAGHVLQRLRIIGYAAARAAQRKCRTHDHRIADPIRNGQRALHIVGDFGRNHRFSDLRHGILKHLTVFSLVYGLGIRADQLDAMRSQKTLFVQLHGQGKARLSAQTRQHTIWFFLFNDALHGFHRQRFQINLIRKRLIRHDSCRIGVHQHHIYASLFEHPACLRARIIKLRRLTNHNRARANHQYFFNILIQRHTLCLPSGP